MQMTANGWVVQQIECQTKDRKRISSIETRMSSESQTIDESHSDKKVKHSDKKVKHSD